MEDVMDGRGRLDTRDKVVRIHSRLRGKRGPRQFHDLDDNFFDAKELKDDSCSDNE